MNDLHAIEELAARGQKIQAIMEFRALTGVGLKEAKDAVEWFQAHGQWPPAYGGDADTGSRPGQVAEPPTPNRRAALEELMASLLQAIADRIGYAPDVRLTARARRLARDGRLVMLRDRVCFAYEDRGQWVIDPMISYDMVTHVATRPGMQTILYVSVGYLHERFELEAAAADAALALFRVFAP